MDPWIEHVDISLENFVSLCANGAAAIKTLIELKATPVSAQTLFDESHGSFDMNWFMGVILSVSLSKNNGASFYNNRRNKRQNNQERISYMCMIRIYCP